MPNTLFVPPRSVKPRETGLTNVLDSGCGLSALKDLLSVGAEFVDVAKIGWGTALVLPDLEDRIALYRRFDVEVCFGGTLFEYAVLTKQLDDYVPMLRDCGVSLVEVSDGTIEMAQTDKLAAIERLAPDFTVYSEVGSKDVNAIVSPARWVAAIRQELEAGATKVILEGREAGTAGLYRASGEMRTGLVDEIIEAGIEPNCLIFEAPQKTHQVYLLSILGPEVNLANIALSDIVPLETLRLGLRSDTLNMFHRPSE